MGNELARCLCALPSFLLGETRSLQRDGIHLFNITYWSDALRSDVGRVKERMEVRYNPRNISRVLAQQLCDVVFEAIQTINKSGVTILLVEQNAYRALEMAEQGFVLETANSR